MKKFTLFLFTLFALAFTNAQTVLYTQDYEALTVGDAIAPTTNQLEGGTATAEVATATGNTTQILKAIHNSGAANLYVRSSNFGVAEGDVITTSFDIATSNTVHIVTIRYTINDDFNTAVAYEPDVAATSTNGAQGGAPLGRMVTTANEFGTTSATFTVPAGFNAARIQVYNFGDTNSFELDNFIVTKKIFTTSGSGTNWNDPNTWAESSVPPANNPVAIDHPVIVNTDASAGDVTVNASLTIEAGKSLTVNGDITTNDNLTLNSTGLTYSSLIVSGNVTGSATYNRYTALSGAETNGTNDLISAPVTGQQFDAFALANTNLATSGSTAAFAPFDNTAASPGAYVNYDTGATTLLAAGTGYRAATTDGSPLKFTGTVNSGTVTTPITIGAGSEWNLIGNPYPSYIKLADFLTENNSKFNASYGGVYGYDGNASDGWAMWNASYSSANPNAIIAPGQGFFVAAASAGPVDVTFTPAMRSTGTSDDFITTNRVAETNVALSKLNLSDGSLNYKTDIYFIDGTSRGLDPGYDSGAYLGDAAGIYTHLVEDNTGIEMAIQALPYNDFNDVVVPLGIKAEAGVELNIGIDAASNLPSNINVYLEDNVANTFTLLNDGDYTLTPSVALSGTGRFFVHYSATTLSLQDSEFNGLQIYASQSPKTLFVKGQLKGATTASLYDIQGRLVLSKKLNQYSNSNKIDISTISTGIYVVKADNGDQVKTQKIIIK